MEGESGVYPSNLMVGIWLWFLIIGIILFLLGIVGYEQGHNSTSGTIPTWAWVLLALGVLLDFAAIISYLCLPCNTACATEVTACGVVGSSTTTSENDDGTFTQKNVTKVGPGCVKISTGGGCKPACASPCKPACNTVVTTGCPPTSITAVIPPLTTPTVTVATPQLSPGYFYAPFATNGQAFQVTREQRQMAVL